MRDTRSRRSAPIVLLPLLLLAVPASATGQGPEDDDARPRLMVTGWAAASLREGQSSLRFGDDVRALGVRVSLHRYRAAIPWVQADRFTRPDLFCPGDDDCAPEGTLLRAGFTLPLAPDDTRPGVHPRVLAGVGVSIAEDDTRFAYLLGAGAVWSLHRRIAPVFEVRWERLPGLRNVVMVNAGLRVGLL